MWLNWIPGILFRDANAQWEQYMGSFVQLIASAIEPYLARNGGPVIMAQARLADSRFPAHGSAD